MREKQSNPADSYSPDQAKAGEKAEMCTNASIRHKRVEKKSTIWMKKYNVAVGILLPHYHHNHQPHSSYTNTHYITHTHIQNSCIINAKENHFSLLFRRRAIVKSHFRLVEENWINTEKSFLFLSAAVHALCATCLCLVCAWLFDAGLIQLSAILCIHTKNFCSWSISQLFNGIPDKTFECEWKLNFTCVSHMQRFTNCIQNFTKYEG